MKLSDKKDLSDFIDHMNSIEDAAILSALSVFWPFCDGVFCDLSEVLKQYTDNNQEKNHEYYLL